MKDEGSNLNTWTNALKFVVKCETLSLEENFQETCFGHVFSKACQYATTNDKACKNLKYVLLNLLRQICRNALLSRRNLVKVVKNGTKLALNLV